MTHVSPAVPGNRGGSSFGSSVYDQVVPGDHFLRQLRELIPWERFSQKLVAYCHAGAQEGRPPYDPALLLRLLLLAFLYNLSERQTEQMVNEPIPVLNLKRLVKLLAGGGGSEGARVMGYSRG